MFGITRLISLLTDERFSEVMILDVNAKHLDLSPIQSLTD